MRWTEGAGAARLGLGSRLVRLEELERKYYLQLAAAGVFVFRWARWMPQSSRVHRAAVGSGGGSAGIGRPQQCPRGAAVFAFDIFLVFLSPALVRPGDLQGRILSPR